MGAVVEPFLKAWALFYICATIGGGLAGAVAGGLLGGILGAVGTSQTTIRFAAAVAGFIAALPISYLVFRFFVSRFLVQRLTASQITNDSSNVAES